MPTRIGPGVHSSPSGPSAIMERLMTGVILTDRAT